MSETIEWVVIIGVIVGNALMVGFLVWLLIKDEIREDGEEMNEKMDEKMDDLISRSALIEAMTEVYKKHYAGTGKSEDFTIAMEMVRKQPTAYDVEKVVADIQAFAECNEDCKKNFYYGQGCSACLWNKIMGIVRKGGVK